jgi:hypothetical protein
LWQGVPGGGGCRAPNHSATVAMSKSNLWCQELFQVNYVPEITKLNFSKC